MENILKNALEAKKITTNLSDTLRNEILNAMANNIINTKDKILEANKIDIQNALFGNAWV